MTNFIFDSFVYPPFVNSQSFRQFCLKKKVKEIDVIGNCTTIVSNCPLSFELQAGKKNSSYYTHVSATLIFSRFFRAGFHNLAYFPPYQKSISSFELFLPLKIFPIYYKLSTQNGETIQIYGTFVMAKKLMSLNTNQGNMKLAANDDLFI